MCGIRCGAASPAVAGALKLVDSRVVFRFVLEFRAAKSGRPSHAKATHKGPPSVCGMGRPSGWPTSARRSALGVPCHLNQARRGVRLVPGRRLCVLAARTERWIANRCTMAQGRGAVGPGPDHRPAGRGIGRHVLAGPLSGRALRPGLGPCRT